MNTAAEIGKILSGFRSISLDELQEAGLMRRKDSKYLFSYLLVPGILSSVSDRYRVLEIEGRRMHNYQTFYYDTPDLEMYFMHHRGMVNRHKIRFRKYGSNEAVFLEVKKKDAKGITIKNRVQTRSTEASILSTEEAFLSTYTPYDHVRMIPVLENSFTRVTLVGLDRNERITVDFQLWFSNPRGEESMELPGLSICEIKFDKNLSGSPFHTALRQHHIVPGRFSKYCTGMALLNPDLKQNLFKEKIRHVCKLNHQYFLSIES